MKTSKYLLFSLFLLIVSALQAQDQDISSKIDEMHASKWQFMVTKTQLSPEDAAKAQPIFMAYEKSIWDLHQKNRDFFRAAMKDSKKVKPNFAQLNDMFVDFEFKQAQLFKNYHIQLRKVLQPETLFNYYRSEREFKRKLLQDFPGRRQQERP